MQLLKLILAAASSADSLSKKGAAADKAAEIASPSVLSMMGMGGPIMIVLALFLLLAVFFIIERWMYIAGRTKIDPAMMSVLKDNLASGRMDAAISYCERGNTAQSQVMATGLRFLGGNMREIESAMETRANVELSAMESNLHYLSLISRIAPMVGFVGTIWGVITIFYTISQVGSLEIGGISKGLYIKMVTSLAGLSVGIIGYSGYQLFLRKIDRFAERLQEQSLNFLEMLNKNQL